MNKIPPKGTRVRTNREILDTLSGVPVPQYMLSNRKADTEGIVNLGVPGTGMEVFYVVHGSSLDDVQLTAVYHLDEFEKV